MHSTVHTRAVEFGKGLVYVIAAFLLFLALNGCVGAPRNVEQLNDMDDVAYHAWIMRVDAWSRAAGYTAVHEKPEIYGKVVAYGTILGTVASSPDPLGEAAAQAGLDSPLVAILVLEGKALLDARGGLPGGGRGVELIHTIADAVVDGAKRAKGGTE